MTNYVQFKRCNHVARLTVHQIHRLPLETSNGLERVAEVGMVRGTAAIKEQEPETVTMSRV